MCVGICVCGWGLGLGGGVGVGGGGLGLGLGLRQGAGGSMGWGWVCLGYLCCACVHFYIISTVCMQCNGIVFFSFAGRSSCIDLYSLCSAWKDRGFCQSSPDIGGVYCKKTCGKCGNNKY